ncbi:MAG: right-handed parallel beta-helix repeat-containing protein [Planctomycetota bacterium]
MRPFPLALLLAALTTAASAQTVYVDTSLSTGANDGTSWADAYQGVHGLQEALNASSPRQQIFATRGLYLPTSTGSRALSFRLRSGVGVYGGFIGGESHPDERQKTGGVFFSLLSADLNGDDGTTFTNVDNSYHVVRTGMSDETAVLDGFVIYGGNADGSSGGNSDRGGGILALNGSSPTIRNCVFDGNSSSFGGGAGYINGAAPRFVDCEFIGNSGGAFGGAFDIATGGQVEFDRCWFEGNTAARAGALEIFATSLVTVTNSVFVDNVATGGSGGGAIWIGSGGSTRIRSCTIVGNSATFQAQGGIRVESASPSVVNTILWNNQGPGGAQGAANQVSPGANVTYSIVEGGVPGAGNLSTMPNFVDLAGRDLRLALPSVGVDAGDSGALPPGTIADADGGRRAVDEPSTPDAGTGPGPAIDIGAYEFTTTIGQVYCQSVANSSGVPGRIDARGSLDAAANDVTLVASSLPQSAFGFFLASRQRDFVPVPGGSTGNLCLGGSIGRYVGPGQVQNTGATGRFELTIDLNSVPQPMGPVAAQAGESWAFQAWHRDAVVGIPTSNFTDGVRITLR